MARTQQQEVNRKDCSNIRMHAVLVVLCRNTIEILALYSYCELCKHNFEFTPSMSIFCVRTRVL